MEMGGRQKEEESPFGGSEGRIFQSTFSRRTDGLGGQPEKVLEEEGHQGDGRGQGPSGDAHTGARHGR